MKLLATIAMLGLFTLDVGPRCNSGSTRSDCERAGGSCVGVSACGVGEGVVSSKSCGGSASIQCCLPTCGGAVEDFYCCNDSFNTRPTCNDGKLECLAGHHVCGTLRD